MKRLILLRHAQAVAKAAAGDFGRRLSARGRADMATVAGTLSGSGYRPDLAVVSPALRTRETWDLARHALGDIPTVFDEAIYDAPAERLLGLVGRFDENAASVMMVGHNPGTEELAARLARGGVGDRVRLAAGMPTASYAVIDLDGATWRAAAAAAAVATGTGRLVAFTAPDDLAPRERPAG